MGPGRTAWGWAVIWMIPLVLMVPTPARAQGGASGPLLAQAPAAPAPPSGSTPSGPAPSSGGASPGAAPTAAPQAPAGPVTPTPPPPTVPSVTFPTFGPVTTPSGEALATFAFHPSIGLTEEYTDNFNLTRTNKEDNFRTSLNLGAVLLINGARTHGQLSASYSPSYDSSTEEASGDRNASLAAQVTYEATPLLTLGVLDSLTRSDEASQGDQLGLRRTRRQFLSNLFSTTATYRLPVLTAHGFYQLSTFFEDGGQDTISNTVGVSASKAFLETNAASIGYQYLDSQTSDGGQDVTQHQVSASVSRQLNAFTAAGVSGSYSIGTTSDNPAPLGTSGNNDFTITSASVFTEYTVPGIWSARASIGYSWLHQDIGEDSAVPSTSTSITRYLGPATLTLGADAGYSQTYATGQNFGVVETWGITGSVSYPVTPLITGTVFGSYRQNRFPGGVAGAGQVKHTEDTWSGSVSLTVPLRQWLSLGLIYTYTDATSSLPDSGYTENRASASLNATF